MTFVRPLAPAHGASPEALEPGTRVGQFIVDELRSEGGFALLHHARHAASGESVALKVLKRALAFQGNAVGRFHREIAALRELSHPNVVRVLDHGDLRDGRPYLVMDWLGGRDLHAHLADVGALTLAETLAVFEPLASALDGAHALGIVHRDLKAQNVMVESRGDTLVPTLVDFGIAHWSARDGASGDGLTSHSVVGSPCSMAPEQILGQPVDARTDVYALGVLLFYMTTGALPFKSTDPLELEEMHLRATPPAPSDLAPLPPAFDALVARCLTKRREERLPTAGAVARELREIARGEPTPRVAAVHVEARVDPTVDDPGDEALDEIDRIVARAHDVLGTAGMRVTSVHAGAVLAVCGVARDAVDVATKLAADLAPARAAIVWVSVSVHAAATEGELRRTGTWVAREPGLWISDAARRADP